jgi:excisionase family DNA binding protein
MQACVVTEGHNHQAVISPSSALFGAVFLQHQGAARSAIAVASVQRGMASANPKAAVVSRAGTEWPEAGAERHGGRWLQPRNSAAPVALVPVPAPAGQAGDRLLTLKEVAKRLGVGRTKTYELVGSGVLPYVELGPRCRRVPERALDEWIRRNTKEPECTLQQTA